MIRKFPIRKTASAGDLVATCHATCVSSAASLVAAASSIVSSAANIGDGHRDVVSLAGSVASILGGTASIVTTISKPDEFYDMGHCEWDRTPQAGVFVMGCYAGSYMHDRGLRRLDIRVVGQGWFSLQAVAPGAQLIQLEWNAEGDDGIFVDGAPIRDCLAARNATRMDITVVGRGSVNVSK